MSAVIEELKLRNFEGYRKADIRFSAGLNLIRGRNSTGKSTLLDALVFALFGEAPDVRPKLLVSRLPDSREMAVYVKFRSPRGGEAVEVLRKGRLDGKGAYRTEERLLRVNGREVPIESDDELRAKIAELLGTSLRKFLNLVYVRQGKLTAILEPPKEQMDSVMGITLLRELREQLDEVRKALEKHEGRDAITEAQNLERVLIPELRSSIEGLIGDIEMLQAEVRGLEELVKKGESPELAELLSQIEERDRTRGEMQRLEAKIQELLRSANASSLEELESKIKDLEKQLGELKEGEEALEEEVEGLLGAWMCVKGSADALENQIREHKSLLEKNVSKCPTCGQDLNRDILLKILRGEEGRLAELRSRETEAEKSYKDKESELVKLKERIIRTGREISDLNSKKDCLKEYLESIGKLDEAVEKLLPQIEAILGKLGLLLQPEDPELKVKVAQQLPIQPEELASKKKALEDKRKALERKLEEKEMKDGELKRLEELLGKLRRQVRRAGLARALSEGFDRGVEARRREFLKRIEFKALEYYKAMTDQHVYSAIAIDPEEYAVWVRPKGLTEAIPANRVGGGHQTLLALSMRLALLDALGFRSLLILDEPTYGVDSDNLPQLAGYIGEASRRLSQMILVTHYNICEEEASNIIEVALQEDGASKAEIKLS